MLLLSVPTSVGTLFLTSQKQPYLLNAAVTEGKEAVTARSC